MNLRHFISIVEGKTVFLTEDEMIRHEEIFKKSTKMVPSDILEKGMTALRQWTYGRKYYRPLQNLLRYDSHNNHGKDDSFGEPAIPVGHSDEQHLESLHGMKNSIDALMNKVSLSDNMSGNRKIDDKTYYKYIDVAKTHQTIKDKGYTSFSTGSHESDVVRSHWIKVFVYKGQKVLPMMHISSAPHEGEVFVARNSIWIPKINSEGQVEIHLLRNE